MNPFQTAYNWFRALRTPAWLNRWYDFLLNSVIFPTLSKIKEEALSDLHQYVIEASKLDMQPTEKFKYVKDKFAIKWAVVLNLNTSTLNWLINLVVAELKEKEII